MRYPGGKNAAGTYQKIINLMPPHEIYIEPFLGSGAILRHKRPAGLNIGIDRDADVLAKVSADIATRSEDRSLIVENCDAGSRWPSLRDFVVREFTAAGCLYRFACGNALNYLATMNPCGRELVYLDPPYLMETRSSGRIYQFELSDADHRQLLKLACGLKCMVMVSGYWSRLYGKAFSKWRSVHFSAITRSGRMAEEWVWCNFPEPTVLHDYRYLGADFREREKLKRRICRWRSRLGRMDGLERQALLCAITESAASH